MKKASLNNLHCSANDRRSTSEAETTTTRNGVRSSIGEGDYVAFESIIEETRPGIRNPQPRAAKNRRVVAAVIAKKNKNEPVRPAPFDFGLTNRVQSDVNFLSTCESDQCG